MSVSQHSKIFQKYVHVHGFCILVFNQPQIKIFGENKMHLCYTNRAFLVIISKTTVQQLLTWHLYQVGIISNLETRTQEDVCRVFVNGMGPLPFICKGSLYLQMCLPWESRGS